MKKLIALLLAALMVLALAACASNASTDTTAPADSAAETEAPAEEAADSTAASGKLTMATEATFPLFERFGFQSGRDADKFAGFNAVERSENGLYYVTEATKLLEYLLFLCVVRQTFLQWLQLLKSPILRKVKHHREHRS